MRKELSVKTSAYPPEGSWLLFSCRFNVDLRKPSKPRGNEKIP
jgi:hypothetical protein